MTLCVCLLCMLMSGLTFSATAAPTTPPDDGFTYTEKIDGTIGIEWVDTEKYGTDIKIPAQINGKDVTSVKLIWNGLTSLDVSYATKLTYLSCSDNNLTSIDISNNPLIDHFYCDNNNITSLDLRNNTKLEELECAENQLTS